MDVMRHAAQRARVLAVLLLGLLGWLAACSLTSDLDDITGGQPPGAGGTGGQGGGSGAQGGCSSVAECPVPASPCEAPICLANQCGSVAQPGGMELAPAEQQSGDCSRRVCDGSGNVIDENDDSDTATAANECIVHGCTSGEPSTTYRPLGTECDGTGTCTGEGECVECNAAGDCTGIELNDCQAPSCVAGQCVPAFEPDGTEVGLQTPGDCRTVVCDGLGGTREEQNGLDVPEDGNECTTNECVGGQPENNPVAGNPTCGTDGSGYCSGGVCTGCYDDDSCGLPTDCLTWTCEDDGSGENVCVPHYTSAGTPVSVQIPHDCKRLECDGNGNAVAVPDDADLPLDDGNACTGEACADGSETHPWLPVNSPCTDGGSYCDGSGNCVECNDGAQCPTPPNCQGNTCLGHVCGVEDLPPGTPAQQQIPGDCKILRCDGSGGTYTEAQDSDLPDDGNECTGDVCTSGVPSHPPAAPGAPCTQGGTVCDGAGACVECVDDSNCLAIDHCTSNKCVDDFADGAPCSRGGQCLSTFCADGNCCDKACIKPCYACVGSKTGGVDGKCLAVKSYTDPDGDCEGDLGVCQNGGCCSMLIPSPAAPGSNPMAEELPEYPKCR